MQPYPSGYVFQILVSIQPKSTDPHPCFMIKSGLSIFLVMLSYTLFAQLIINGRVLDKETDEPIPFMSIGINESTVATISELNGEFSLEIPQEYMGSVITFSALGYKRQLIPIDEFKRNGFKEILFTEHLNVLDEVQVRDDRKFKTSSFKVSGKLSGLGSIAPSSPEAAGAAVAVRVSNPYPSAWLHSASVGISINHLDSLKIRLRIFSMDKETKEPSTDIIQDDVVKSFDMKKGWAEFPLDDLYVPIPQGEFYLVFELIEEKAVRERTAMNRKRKKDKILELYERGVEGVNVTRDSTSNGVQTRWSHSLNAGKAKKYGIDFPTETTAFRLVNTEDYPTYIRSSAFDNWRYLEPRKYSMALKARYVLEYEEGGNEPGEITESFIEPIQWGTHSVGFRYRLHGDSNRLYGAQFFEDGEEVPPGTPRPIQVSEWFPTTTFNERVTIQTLGEAVSQVEKNLDELERIEAIDYELEAEGIDPEILEKKTQSYASDFVSGTNHPVVIYSPGLGSESVENNTLCEFLASHGYMVYALSSLGVHERKASADMENIQEQLQDLEYLIKYIAASPHADTSSMTLIGHSWGALTNLVLALNHEGKFEKLVSLDGSSYHHFDVVASDLSNHHLSTPWLYLGTEGKSKEAFGAIHSLQLDSLDFRNIPVLNHGQFVSLANLVDYYSGNLTNEQYHSISNEYARMLEVILEFVEKD